MSTWFVNASPLILLGKINRLALLTALPQQMVVPREVADEVVAGPVTDKARQWLAKAGAEFIGARIPADSRILLAWDLGAGETAVLSHAIRTVDSVCVLDDRAARDCAAVFNLRVAGSIGILLRAKRAGLLSAVRPEVDALLSAGAMLSDGVVCECLRLAGEDN